MSKVKIVTAIIMIEGEDLSTLITKTENQHVHVEFHCTGSFTMFDIMSSVVSPGLKPMCGIVKKEDLNKVKILGLSYATPMPPKIPKAIKSKRKGRSKKQYNRKKYFGKGS